MVSKNGFKLPANWKIEAIVWVASQKGMSYVQFSESEGLYGPGSEKLNRIYEDYKEHFYQEREAEVRRIKECKNKAKQRLAEEATAC